MMFFYNPPCPMMSSDAECFAFVLQLLGCISKRANRFLDCWLKKNVFSPCLPLKLGMGLPTPAAPRQGENRIIFFEKRIFYLFNLLLFISFCSLIPFTVPVVLTGAAVAANLKIAITNINVFDSKRQFGFSRRVGF